MPRLQVVVLDQVDANTYKYIVWADVPTARQPFYAAQNRESAWLQATQADNDALSSGAMVERTDTFHVTPGTGLAAVQTMLQTIATRFQTEINNANPWARYGTRYDGTTWTSTGVA